jgi:predicted ATPase/DNA-binding SARP family transcriptional activator
MSPVWQIYLLGGLRAERGDEVVTRFRSQKIGALLAYLALFPQRPHAREELAGLFWPDAEPEAARTNLRTALSSLRRQLEPPGTMAGLVLVSRSQGDMNLNPDVIETDVARYENALKSAARPGTPGDEQARLLTGAVDLYRGPLLPGLYETWALTERDRLAEAYLDALRRLVAHHEQSGDPTAALAFARRAVSADPLAEEAHADVIRLLQTVGDRAGARRQFDELARLLDEQFGAEPAPETRALLDKTPAAPRRVREVTFAVARNSHADRPARGDAERPVPPTADAAAPIPPVSPTPVPSPPPSPPPALHLPLTLTRFFGREQELTALRARLAPDGPGGSRARLVTITGPGGSGKTRLAVEAARGLGPAFTGGVWFVPLADLREAEHIGGALAQSLGLPRTPAPPLEQAIAALRERADTGGDVLLVFDNFEQLVDEGGTEVAQQLLAGVPSVSCLVTSRQRLLIDGEQEFALAPLPAPPVETGSPERLLESPCVQLFVDRARAARADFQLSAGNANSVATLCSKLEGVPLAIELAASWAQTLTPTQMRERLTQRFDLLVTRRRGAPGRHQSLRAAIEWGWELLTPEARDFFAQLSVFRGGWTLEAAEAVTGRADALLLLSALRDRSFILTEEERDEAARDDRDGRNDTDGGAQMRFRMLETLREFADEQVGRGAPRAALDTRHFEYFSRLVTDAEPSLYGPEQALALRRLEAEHDNLRVALTRALERDPAAALRLAGALSRFWEVAAHVREGGNWLERALLATESAAEDAGDDSLALVRADALDKASRFAWFQRDWPRARARAEESLRLYRRLNDAEGLSSALAHTASLLFLKDSDVAGARALLDEALRLSEAAGAVRPRLAIYEWLCVSATTIGIWEEGERHGREWLLLARQLGDRTSESAALMWNGMPLVNQNEPRRARVFFEQGIALSEASGETFWGSGNWFGLGMSALLEGNTAEARACGVHSLQMLSGTGYDYVHHYVVELLAYTAAAEGDAARCARLLGAVDHLRQSTQTLAAKLLGDVFEPFVALARTRLGDAEYDRQYASGAGLALPEALSLATQDPRIEYGVD